MPFIRIWVHLIWSTKNQEALLTDGIRQQVFKHIKDNAIRKGIFVDCINGYHDHVHCLISLGSDQTIAQIMKQMKGESAFWINQQKLTDGYFGWQEEYFAISVSESVLTKTRTYIENQESHHRDQLFKTEREHFLERYGFN